MVEKIMQQILAPNNKTSSCCLGSK